MTIADNPGPLPAELVQEAFGGAFVPHGVRVREHEEALTLEVPIEDIHSHSAGVILSKVLPKFLDHFLLKNKDYRDQHRSGLGPRGEFVGLHRKMAKLQYAIWEGQRMQNESVEEMLWDLIGTAFLTLDLLNLED